MTGAVTKNLSGQWKLSIPSYIFESKILLRLLRNVFCRNYDLGTEGREKEYRVD